MPVTAAVLWYFVVFEPGGALAMMPTPFETADECQAALAEFQADNPSSPWEPHCIAPNE